MLWLYQRHALETFQASVRDEEGHLLKNQRMLLPWRLAVYLIHIEDPAIPRQRETTDKQHQQIVRVHS